MARTRCNLVDVQIETLSPGDGVNFPKKGDKVTIHYVGTLADGKKFDSSRDRNDPFVTRIGVGHVIKGWDEGVPQLSLGQKAILTVSPKFGYADRGFPPVIPPNATLTFEVELLKIN
ncbi:peptidyl-prolyl cis-trans isomerase [Hysterangium stoloniferum]|nr:peptidyl-prolyl cis-trans isomerase [Hysterangium stoloniferum]